MDPTDEELNTFILSRLALIGVDLSVLPEDDPSAPADRQGVLASVRSFLRTTPPTISDHPLDTQAVPPVLYPAELTAWTQEERR